MAEPTKVGFSLRDKITRILVSAYGEFWDWDGKNCNGFKREMKVTTEILTLGKEAGWIDPKERAKANGEKDGQ